jgi:hypothetical protein
MLRPKTIYISEGKNGESRQENTKHAAKPNLPEN